MDLAVLRVGRCGERLDGLERRDVGLDPDRLGTRGAQLGNRTFQSARFDVGNDQFHALAREPLGQRLSDSAGPASDNSDATPELVH